MTWLSKFNLPRTPKPMRAPVSLNDQVGAAIGKVLEFSLTRVEVRHKRPHPRLVWFPGLSALGWFVGAPSFRSSRLQFEELEDAGLDLRDASSSFAAFMGRGPDFRATSFGLSGAANWYSIGAATRIDYWSDKFRAEREYTHALGKGVRLFVYGSPRREKPSFWMMRGGKLRVTSRGIEG